MKTKAALLFFIFLICCQQTVTAENELTAYPLQSTIFLDGNEVQLEAYKIEGEDYFKLRDLAYLLSDTSRQFDLVWNQDTKAISIEFNVPYTATGDEMVSPVAGSEKNSVKSEALFELYGGSIEIPIYQIEGFSYIRLSDANDLLDTSATYYEAADSILITTRYSSSWEHISEQVYKPRNWKQFVSDSAFKLGELIINESYGNYQEFGTYPRIDGSTVAVPMAVEFAWQHLGSLYDMNYFVAFSTTHYAYERLITSGYGSYAGSLHSYQDEDFTSMDEFQPVDLIIVTAPSEEEEQLAKEHNVELVMEPLCYDAFVFITHQDNPVDSLTVEEIQKIYSGEISNWQDVGGEDMPIIAFQREKNSGSQTAMEEMVMDGKPMVDAPDVLIYGMSGLVNYVSDYQNGPASIGYTYQYYVDRLYPNENIKILKINGIEPSDENLRNNAYPFTTHYYGVIKETDLENTSGKFLTWMLSEEGQRSIRQAGYVPIVEIAE